MPVAAAFRAAVIAEEGASSQGTPGDIINVTGVWGSPPPLLSQFPSLPRLQARGRNPNEAYLPRWLAELWVL